MRNLDIADSRAKLEQYAALGLVGTAHVALTGAGQSVAPTELIGVMAEGGAEAITENANPSAADDTLLDRAALESGTD
jgi:argininosuccinate synthase